MEDYYKRVEKLKELIDEADYILIGAGAGLSTAFSQVVSFVILLIL